MAQREVTDAAGVKWTCVQAFTGLSDDKENKAASKVEGTRDRVYVVCTPSGGAQSVRIEIAKEWESWPEQALLDAISAARPDA